MTPEALAERIETITDHVSHDGKCYVGWISREERDLLLSALRQPSRDEVLEEAAKVVQGEIYKERYRKWPCISTQGNHFEYSNVVEHCDALAAHIRSLKSSPAPGATS